MPPEPLFPAHPAPPPLSLPYPLALGRAGLSGFPSPAQDYEGRTLDLNEHLVKRPSATFFTSVTGDSMVPLGIHEGDLPLVDRFVDPRIGHILVAMVEGEITVKRYELLANRPHLCSGDSRYAPIQQQQQRRLGLGQVDRPRSSGGPHQTLQEAAPATGWDNT